MTHDTNSPPSPGENAGLFWWWGLDNDTLAHYIFAHYEDNSYKRDTYFTNSSDRRDIMIRIAATTFVLTLACPFVTGIIGAGVPQVISYQGRLTNTDGVPIADTTTILTFTIYDAAIEGAELWTSGFQEVAITDGLFAYGLGSSVAFTEGLFKSDSARYLGIRVDTDSEIEPRTELISVAYALRSQGADTAEVAITVVDDAITSSNIQNGSILLSDIGQNGADTGQVMKWDGGAWIAQADEVGNGSNWTVTDSVLYTNSYLGIARGGAGNVLLGDSTFTHVNLGVNSVTGYLGLDFKYATVGGGVSNVAGGEYATVGGGYNNTAGNSSTISGGVSNSTLNEYGTIGGGDGNSIVSLYGTIGGGYHNYVTGFGWRGTIAGGGENSVSSSCGTVGGGIQNFAAGDFGSTIGGGSYNHVVGTYATVGGGSYNYVAGRCSAILGGSADSIMYGADYSYLFGINSNLTEDSTFMVDMPHIRFGDEATGYEVPSVDGAAGQVMATDGSGQVSWTDPSGSTGMVPVGSVTAWLKSFPNLPSLPANFVECNGQVLSDPQSVLDGQTIPDLNGEQRFMRGASVSGALGGSETHSHASGNAPSSGWDSGEEEANHLPPYYEVVWIMRVK